MRKNKIAVVGAGVGGLSAAARLAKQGYEVEVYEKLSECGGRAHMIEDRGFKFDTGPSFVMMPDFFQEAFDYCQENINDYLDLKTLEVSYKLFYPGGKTLSVHKNSERTEEELEKIEPGSSKGFKQFLKETGELYTSIKPLLYRCLKKSDAFDFSMLKLLPSLKLGMSYWDLAKKYFKSDELCYAFTFEAMFIGVSPFNTPAIYSIISYTDHAEKIAHSMGGMYEIPKAFEKMALKFGAKINYNSEVTEISKNGNFSLKLQNGNSPSADMAVVNADFSHAQSDLLKRRLPVMDYSCSVYLMYIGTKKKVTGLEHHNLFFAKDLNQNLKDIFFNKTISEDFSFYIHVPTITDTSLAPIGKDIVYILVPVANMEKQAQNFSEYESMVRRIVFERVKEHTDLDLEDLIEVEHKFYPQDFINRYNIKYAATFGLAHTLRQSAFLRPANIDSKIKGLYYVGASTQPGGGLPPVIASSRIVADLISKKT